MTPKIEVNEKVLANLKEKLTSAPADKGMSLWQLMVGLKPALEQARQNGKTVEEMHEDLLASGIDANWGTFKKYASELLSDSTATGKAKVVAQVTVKHVAAAAEKNLRDMPLTNSQSHGLRNMRFANKRAPGLNQG
jgi:hypothetical protein